MAHPKKKTSKKDTGTYCLHSKKTAGVLVSRQMEGRLNLMHAERFQLSFACFKAIYRWMQKDAQFSKKRPIQGHKKFFDRKHREKFRVGSFCQAMELFRQ